MKLYSYLRKRYTKTMSYDMCILLSERLNISFQQTLNMISIGSGCYGHVFSLNSKKVIKLTKDLGELDIATKQKRHKRPALPYIYDVFMVDDKLGAIVMEKLNKAPYKLKRLLELKFLYKRKNLRSFPPVIQSQVKTLEKSLKALSKKLKTSCFVDLHAGNFLMRGEQIVAIDISTFKNKIRYKYDVLSELI